jgi:hypothetical protein
LLLQGTGRRVALLLLAGCDKATGGGWIPGTMDAQANFGFTVKCRTTQASDGSPIANLYDGQIEWNDGAIRFHGDVQPVQMTGSCEDVHQPAVTVFFQGTYRPKPNGLPGSFVAMVTDGGEPGTINGDAIAIQLNGGQFNGYSNGGSIQGGNIQIR